jgi:hypothetical protein
MNDKTHRRHVGQSPFRFGVTDNHWHSETLPSGRTVHKYRPPEPQEKSGLGALVALIGMLACLVGAIGWTLWGAV